jgi:hypothetical protein
MRALRAVLLSAALVFALVPVASAGAPPTDSSTSDRSSSSSSSSCSGSTVTTTNDSSKPLKITKPGVYDGAHHKVPSITIKADCVTVKNFVVSGGSQTGIVSEGHDNTISDNDISQISYGTDDLDALRFFGDNTKILRNKVHNLVKGKLRDAHPDGGAQTWASKSHPTSSHVLIADNDWRGFDFHQCVTAEGPKSTDGPGGGSGTSSDWTIRNNHCEGTSNQAIVLRDIHDVRIVGNTFAGKDNKAVQMADGTSGVTFSGNVLGPRVKALSGD